MHTLFQKIFKPVLGKIPGLNPTFSIGLELGRERLNLVQMTQVSGKTCIQAMTSIPYAGTRDELYQDPDKLKTLLKRASATQPFKGKRVVSCLSADKIKLITISYQQTQGQEDSVAVIAELRERLKGDLDDKVVDFMTLRQESNDASKRDALVALAPRDKVMAHLDLLTSAGLEVDALDIGPAALARLISHAGASQTPEFPNLPNVLLINFGTASTYLSVIWGRRLMLDRTVEFSQNRLFARLKQVLDMPQPMAIRLLYEKHIAPPKLGDNPDEVDQMVAEVLRPEITQLVLEINKTLVYMASRTRGKSIDKVYLAGQMCNYPGMMNSLRTQLNVAVEVLDPLKMFPFAKNKPEINGLGTMAGMALTTGLALRKVPENA